MVQPDTQANILGKFEHMANLTSGKFEKFNPLKIKPEVAENEQKFFSGTPGENETFST